MKKINRTLLWILLGAIVCSAIFMLSLPTVLSTRWAKEEFLKNFNQRISGNLVIDRLELGWFSSQRISGLELRDKQGERILSIDQMSIPSSLVRLFWRGSGDFDIKNLEARIEWLTPTRTNLEEILNPNLPASTEEVHPLAFFILNHVNARFSTQSKQAFIDGEVSNGHESGKFMGNITLDPQPFISLDVHQLPVDILAPFSKKEILKQILGNTIDLTINQKMGLNHISEITAEAHSSHMSAKIAGVIQDFNFSLKEPAELSLASTDELNRVVFQDEFENIKYAFETNRDFKIHINTLNFSFKEPHNLDLKANLVVPELRSVKNDSYNFEGIQLTLSSQGKLHPLAFKINGEVLPSFSNQKIQTGGTLNSFTFVGSGTADIEKNKTLVVPYFVEVFSKNGKDSSILNFEGTWSSDADRKKQFSATGSITNFPLSYLRFWHESPLLSTVLGPTLTGHFNLHLDDIKEKKGHLNFIANGANWNSKGNLGFDKNVRITEPIKVVYSLTPAMFKSFQEKMTPLDLQVYSLANNLDISLLFKEGRFPLENGIGSLQTKLEKCCLDLALSVPAFTITNDVTGQSMSFSQFDGEISSENFQKEFLVALNIAEASHQMAIQAKGIIQNILTNNRLDLKKASFDLEANIHQFSLPLFAKLLVPTQFAHQLESLLGPEINGKLAAKIEEAHGPLHFTVAGSNGQFELFGNLKNGFLHLTQPLQFQVNATPNFKKTILDKIHPLFGEVTSIDQPLRITIDPQGFTFPLFSFNLRQLQIKKGTMSIGKITFNNNGAIKTIQSIFKIDSAQDISIMFTPLFFSMQKGDLKLERVDLQIEGEHPMAVWGDINFIQDRVDLTVGLTAPVLKKAFEIADLPQDYILQIPVTGTLDNASIDITTATGKITALIAKNQKNAQGKIVGTFLDILSGKLKEKPVPPPTTYPLPWQALIESQETTNPTAGSEVQ